MAELLLKKGSYENFKSKIFNPEKNIANAIEGALYFTEDEGGLYLGKSDKTVVRIQGTLHQYNTLQDFTSENSPPFSKDIVYFIADRDALIRWNGSAWVQLNTPAATSVKMSSDIAENKEKIKNLTDDLGTLTTTVTNNKDAIENTVSGIDTRLKAAEKDIDDLQEQIRKKVETEDFNILSNTVKDLGDNITDIQKNYVKTETFNTSIDDINNDIAKINEALGLGDNTSGDNAVASRLTALESDNTTNKTNIATNKQDIEELGGILGTTNESLEALIGRVETTEEDIDSLESRMETAEGDINSLEGRMGTAEGQISTLIGDLSDAQEDIESLTGTVGDLVRNSATNENLESLETILNGKIDALEEKTDNTNSDLTDLTGRVETAEGNIAEQGRAIQDINDAWNGLAESLETELKGKIDADILAANAMTYKGGVASENNLPDTPSVGDTYIVTSKSFTLGDNKTVVYAGDLLIAQSKNGEETNGVIPANQLEWDHVSTGYSSVFNPKLITENIDNRSVITLTDFAEAPIGQVYLESASENIVISIDSEKTNTIKFELQWGSF